MLRENLLQVNSTQSNALSIGLQGFQDAQSRVSEAAYSIASLNVKGSTNASVNQNQLVTSLVDLKVAELDAKVNAKVLQTASGLIGSLLDIRA